MLFRSVTVIGEKNASDGALWYEIRFSASNGAETTGYVLNSYVKFPVTYQSDKDFEAYLTNQGFPESYIPSRPAWNSGVPIYGF